MKRIANAKSLVLLSLVLSLILPAVACALEHSFSESFVNKTYCDTANTTAWWHRPEETGLLQLWPFHMGVTGNLPLVDRLTSGVVISGNFAYVTIRSSGLKVINISDPANPVEVGSCATSGAAYAVAVDGDYAYVADGSNGLRVIDISVSSNPTVVGGYGEGVTYLGVTVSGDYAYVAAGGDGLVVLDISNPVSPSLAGSRDASGYALETAISGNYAFVANSANGLLVIDISDPTSPDSVGTYATPDSAKGVVISGDRAFVAGCGSGLQIIDITDPASPSLEGRCDTDGRAVGVAVNGDYAYVADGSAGLQTISIGNTADPSWRDSCRTSDYATKVVVRGEFAYVTDRNGGFKIIHVADATLPPLRAGNLAVSAPGRAVDVDGDCAYLTRGSYLLAVDISVPYAPDTVGIFGPLGGEFTDVAVSGDYAYATEDSLGFQVIDVSDPHAPFAAGSCSIPGGGYGLALAGDYAYVAAGPSGLRVVDISDPANPSVAGSCSISGYAYGVAVSGDIAYVAAGSGGLSIVDISDPTNPSEAVNFITSDMARGVAISGDIAYVAAGTQGLVIIDISTPQSPSLVSVCGINGYAHSVVAEGRYVFVCRYLALCVVDAGNPASPTLVATHTTLSECFGIAISGNHAFLAEEPASLEVVQVYQREFDLQRNTGQSIVFFESEEEISAAKVLPIQTESIYWYVSADSGANWILIPTDGQWHPLDPPGHDLLWRSKHYYRVYAENPTCNLLGIEWKYSFAEIDSVRDVPEDEGGWVRVRFDRSGLDFPGGGGDGGTGRSGGDKTDGSTFGVNQVDAIKNYFLHRRIDDIGFIGKLLESGKRVEDDKPVTMNSGNGISPVLEPPPSIGGAQGYVMDGHYYQVSQGSGGFPPGIWESVGSVPAIQQEQYYCLVPSAADSMSALRYTVYCVTAHTSVASSYFISPPDSGYSRDNLPPRQPGDLKGDYGYPPPRLFMSWGRNSERDFSHYAVYKGSSEGFVPSETNRIGMPWDTSLVDEEFDPNAQNYYKVSAWDIHENEGTFSLLRPEDITAAGHPPAVPTVTFLEQNMPNPFNPVTVIRFSISHPGRVVLRVYDVAGRSVRTLAEGTKGAARYEVRWDGRDDSGRSVPSGVYLYKLEAPWYGETRKMVLIK